MSGDPARAFWAEVSACEHFVQIYEADAVFMDTLAGFIGAALTNGEGAVVIGTPGHRGELDRRLTIMGFDVDFAKSNDQFLSLDAEALWWSGKRDEAKQQFAIAAALDLSSVDKSELVRQRIVTTGGVCPNANEIEPNQPLGYGLARTWTLAATKTASLASGSVRNALLSPPTRSHPGNVG